MPRSKKPKKTKIQRAADKFRKKVDEAAAPLLMNVCGDTSADRLINNQKQHHEARSYETGEECIYCGKFECDRVDVHGPEHDEREELLARDAAAYAEQRRIYLAHYTAAREVVADFWSVDSSKVLNRIAGLEEALFDRCETIQNLRVTVGVLLFGFVVVAAGFGAVFLKVFYP